MDNKAVVRSFLDTLWNGHDPESAAQWLHPQSIEHNPFIAQAGHAGFVTACNAVLSQHPDTSLTFHALIAEGDMVVAHVHWKTSADDPGAAAADIFRVIDGLIVEHWDVIQPIPTQAPPGMMLNPNGMF